MSDAILVMGLEAEGEGIERAEFDSDAALDRYAAAVLDPVAVPALWSRLAGGQAASAEARADAAHRLLALLQRRRREAAGLLRRGGTLVCILRPLGQPVHVRRPGPRGAAATVLHAYSWLPEEPSLARLVITAEHGGELRAADEAHPIWRLIRAQGGEARTAACAANAPAPANWHIVATDQAGRLAAFEVRVGQGRLLFVPPLAADGPAELGALIAHLLAAERQLPQEPAETARPHEWLDDVVLPGQAELHQRLEELAQQIEGLEKQFIEVRKQHGRLVEVNKLLAARTNGELAGPAASAFRLLGFRVELVASDLLALQSDEGTALAALAASADAVDSDSYWALVHRLDDGPHAEAKGIILGNAFCSTPPGERGDPFSAMLRRGAQHRDVCLLSTVELHRALAALLERPDDEEMRRKLRVRLLQAVGPCSLSEDAPSAERPE